MIEVEISSLFFIYLTITLVILFFSWMYFEFFKKKKGRKKSEKVVLRCSICAHAHLIDTDETFSKCPRCGNLIEIEKK